MIKQLMKDTVVYGSSAMINGALQLLAFAILAQEMSQGEYGTLDFIILTVSTISILGNADISQAVTRFSTLEHDESVKNKIFATGLLVSVIGYGMIIVAAVLLKQSLSETFNNGRVINPSVVVLCSLAIAANGLYLFTVNQLRFELKSKHYALATFTASVSIPVGVLIAKFQNVSLSNVLIILIISYSSGTLISLKYLVRRVTSGISLKLLLPLLRYSSPFIFVGLAASANAYIDRFFVNRYLGMEDVSIYAVSYRVAAITLLLLAGFQGSITPAILNNVSSIKIESVISESFRIFYIVASAFVIGVGVLSGILIPVVFGRSYQESAAYVAPLSISLLVAGAYIFFPGEIIKAKSMSYLKSSVYGAVVNILLNLIFVPKYGIGGAVTATTCGSLVSLGYIYHRSQKSFHIIHNWKRYVAATAYQILIFVLLFQGNHEGLDLLIRRTLLVLLIVPVLFLSRVLTRKDMVWVYEIIKTSWLKVKKSKVSQSRFE